MSREFCKEAQGRVLVQQSDMLSLSRTVHVTCAVVSSRAETSSSSSCSSGMLPGSGLDILVPVWEEAFTSTTMDHQPRPCRHPE